MTQTGFDGPTEPAESEKSVQPASHQREGTPHAGEPDEGSEGSAGSAPECSCSGCPAAGSLLNPEPEAGRAAASIVACPNGPLLVRGDFEIVTPDGVPIPRDRETVALCRCGGSAIKPFCDGTHKLMKFDTSRRRPVPTAVVERSGGTGERS